MKEEKYFSVFNHKIKQSDLFKLCGLLVFFVLCAIVVFAMYPLLAEVFEPGGVDRVIEDIRSKGVFGVFILLGMQFLQIIVAFIPGEVVQIAAGMLYGPWAGSALILIGCLISAAFIYQLVHRLGAPFVQAMVSEKHMTRFKSFEHSGKLNVTVFVLYLIPGFPKDVLTYIVPLSDMKMSTFLAISTIGRIPGVLVSTYAAAGLIEGDTTTSIVIFVVAALILLAGVIFKNRIMALMQKKDSDTQSKNLGMKSSDSGSQNDLSFTQNKDLEDE